MYLTSVSTALCLGELMRRIQYCLCLVLFAACSSLANQPKKDTKIYTDREKAPSIDFYGIDQTENIDAAKWQSAKIANVIDDKNYLPIIRIPVKNKSNVDGWAIFTFTVNEQGSTTAITLIDEEPKGKFSKEAAHAISKFKYRPYSPNGTPQKVRNVWHIFEFKNTERVAMHVCGEGDDEVLKGKKNWMNQEKYLAMSKEERIKICTMMKKNYEHMISGNCITQLDARTKAVTCMSGKRLETAIEFSKHECQFACQP